MRFAPRYWKSLGKEDIFDLMKRILTVQDISCVGKCSLSVALPIISALGSECAVLPTAVLSTHTAFKHFTVRELTDDMRPIWEVWDRENIAFDAVYTGYLASERQLELAVELCERYPDAFILVDPVMGDFGRLYSGFSADFPKRMKKLCDGADVIMPNLTEAYALLGEKYREDAGTNEYRELAKRLCEGGAKIAVITGYEPKDGRCGALKYDSRSGTFFEYTAEKVQTDMPLHGTGDIFASVFAGVACKGRGLDSALAAAVDFTAACVKRTALDSERRWYGVSFEKVLPKLWEYIK